MKRQRDRELEARFRELRAPGESDAEARAWPVVREAYAERTPVRPTPRLRRFALAAAGGVAALAIGLSPAGAKVGDLVRDVVGVGQEDARPALRALPAAGELLVESEQGVWLVRSDGSKRLLGEYDQATWSPHGIYIAATAGNQLVAMEPNGEVRWTIDAPGPVRDPRWRGDRIDTSISYRSDGDLWVVAGDGTGARRVAGEVGAAHPRQTHGAFAPSPVDGRSATVERDGRRSTLAILDEGRRRVAFTISGRLTRPVWSPDGRWLLIGWPAGDQWLFVDADKPRRVIAFDRISAQFDPGGTAGASFPRPTSWILPDG